jgi:hypothetical protein
MGAFLADCVLEISLPARGHSAKLSGAIDSGAEDKKLWLALLLLLLLGTFTADCVLLPNAQSGRPASPAA